MPVACVPWPKLETGAQRSVVGVEGRGAVVGREGSPALVGLGTSVPDFVVGAVDVGGSGLGVVIYGSLLGCRGALTREKPTSVGWILVFANGVSASRRLWEGFRGWRSWRGVKIPWGSCLQAVVEQE